MNLRLLFRMPLTAAVLAVCCAAAPLAHAAAPRDLSGIWMNDNTLDETMKREGRVRMTEAERNDAVMAALRGALARDRAPVQVTGFSPLGLVEMTRKRIREPLGHQLTEACSPCEATGRQPSPATVGCRVLRQAERTADAAPGRPLGLKVSADVADWLRAEPFARLEGLIERLGTKVRLEVHGGLRVHYEVNTLDPERSGHGR